MHPKVAVIPVKVPCIQVSIDVLIMVKLLQQLKNYFYLEILLDNQINREYCAMKLHLMMAQKEFTSINGQMVNQFSMMTPKNVSVNQMLKIILMPVQMKTLTVIVLLEVKFYSEENMILFQENVIISKLSRTLVNTVYSL